MQQRVNRYKLKNYTSVYSFLQFYLLTWCQAIISIPGVCGRSRSTLSGILSASLSLSLLSVSIKAFDLGCFLCSGLFCKATWLVNLRHILHCWKKKRQGERVLSKLHPIDSCILVYFPEITSTTLILKQKSILQTSNRLTSDLSQDFCKVFEYFFLTLSVSSLILLAFCNLAWLVWGLATFVIFGVAVVCCWPVGLICCWVNGV